MSQTVPELIADHQCECGENPLWHPAEKRLYWVDIPTGRMFRYDPATGAHEQCYAGEVVGGFTVQEDGALLLFMARGAVRAWRDGFLGTAVPEIPRERESRFNDVIADPLGAVFGGTMARGISPGACTAWKHPAPWRNCWRGWAVQTGWVSPPTAQGCTSRTP